MKLSKTVVGYTITIIIFIVHSIDNSLHYYSWMGLVNKYLSEIILLIITSSWFVFDTLLWKLPLIDKINGIPPNISGKWNVEIESSYDNKKIQGVCTIKQTFSNLRISINFNENSYSTTSFYHFEKEGEFWFLCYGYKANPSIKNNGSSHFGFGKVKIGKNRLSGNYVNDNINRETYGKVVYTRINSK